MLYQLNSRKLWLGCVAALWCLTAATSATVAQEAKASGIRLGMIGLDTSHAPAFAKLFNGTKGSGEYGDMRLVAAFPGGSPDIHSSHSRVAGFTAQSTLR